MAGIGAEKAAANELEALDVQKENVRVGIGGKATEVICKGQLLSFDVHNHSVFFDSALFDLR